VTNTPEALVTLFSPLTRTYSIIIMESSKITQYSQLLASFSETNEKLKNGQKDLDQKEVQLTNLKEEVKNLKASIKKWKDDLKKLTAKKKKMEKEAAENKKKLEKEEADKKKKKKEESKKKKKEEKVEDSKKKKKKKSGISEDTDVGDEKQKLKKKSKNEASKVDARKPKSVIKEKDPMMTRYGSACAAILNLGEMCMYQMIIKSKLEWKYNWKDIVNTDGTKGEKYDSAGNELAKYDINQGILQLLVLAQVASNQFKKSEWDDVKKTLEQIYTTFLKDFGTKEKFQKEFGFDVKGTFNFRSMMQTMKQALNKK
jgi:predicted  nucleic acid-binding Zn-ribbon protein